MSTEERVAVLETQMDDLKETLAKLEAGQEAMLLKLTKHEGQWGGIIMTITAVGACLAFFKDYIVDWFSSGR